MDRYYYSSILWLATVKFQYNVNVCLGDILEPCAIKSFLYCDSLGESMRNVLVLLLLFACQTVLPG